METINDNNKNVIKKIIICGAGVIGCSIAYQLALRKAKDYPELEIIVIERCGVACAASGKAGGFLAKDWCDNSPLKVLARKSFAMHDEFAESFANPFDYRKLDTLSLMVDPESIVIEKKQEKETKKQKKNKLTPFWINDKPVEKVCQLGTTESTAQIHPAKFTHTLLNAAIEKGVQLKVACVKDIIFSDDSKNKVTGVVVKRTEAEGDGDEEKIEADVVIIAMGPWTKFARKWFSTLPKVSGQRAHSITFLQSSAAAASSSSSSSNITPHALFTDYRDPETRSFLHPEVYPRPDGEIYICGATLNIALPEDPKDALPDSNALQTLQRFASHILTEQVQEAYSLDKTQCCFLPMTQDGLPLIGHIPHVEGAFVAAGHSCWGILNSPATGLAMAELILDGTSHTIDISAFNPKREK